VAVPILRLGKLVLHYEALGDGPAILGIHGTPSSTLLWADAARRLSAVGRCVIYDRRGFGRSSPAGPTSDLDDHLRDAVAVLDRVIGAPAVVIGRSTGGLIALALGVRHPERIRALVLLEPAVFAVDGQAAAWAAGLRAAVLRADPGRASEVVLRVALGDGAWSGLPRDVADHLAAASSAVLAELHGDQLDLSDSPYRPTDDQLRAMAVPTMLVSAEQSPAALHRVNVRLADVLPEATLQVVPGGHLIDPADPAVLDFIRRVTRTA
jgi:pimeloyl-ACP methyl ester carboxylesterase